MLIVKRRFQLTAKIGGFFAVALPCPRFGDSPRQFRGLSLFQRHGTHFDKIPERRVFVVVRGARCHDESVLRVLRAEIVQLLGDFGG